MFHNPFSKRLLLLKLEKHKFKLLNKITKFYFLRYKLCLKHIMFIYKLMMFTTPKLFFSNFSKIRYMCNSKTKSLVTFL
jgi:hypothetical protein